MAKVTVALPADLVLDVMVLADIRNAQDAVEAVLRDYLARGRRTEAITGGAPDERERLDDRRPPTSQG
jgi:Arc/MetJ family transcription regulator